MKKEAASQTRLVVTSIFILVLSQVFMAGLSTGSFEKIYLNFLTASYDIVARDFRRSVDQGLRFGKPLEKLFGIDRLMEEIHRKNEDLDNIALFKPDGEMLYSLQKAEPSTFVPKALQIDFTRDVREGGSDTRTVLLEGRFHVLLPIISRENEWIGTIDLSFDEGVVESRKNAILLSNLKVLGAVTFAATILLAFLVLFFVSSRSGPDLPRRRVLFILAFVLVLAQLITSAANIRDFRSHYIEITRLKIVALTDRLRENIDHLLNKGVQINRLVRIEDVFEEILGNTMEIEKISITDTGGAELYAATTQRRDAGCGSVAFMSAASQPGDFEVFFPLRRTLDEKEVIEGFIKVHLSECTISKAVSKILLDAVTVVLISFLFLVELVIFFLIYMRKEMQSISHEEEASFTYVLGRPVAFMYLFSVALSISFIPLQMKNLYEPMLGLSKEIVLALPISIEMLCAMITAFLAGMAIDRWGWHIPFGAGIGLSACGAFLSGNASTGLEFIVFRGIVGLGYGLSWMDVQGYVFTFTDPRYRARGISNLVAGIFSGQICGTAVGAMLAERIGYPGVFIAASALTFLPLFFVLIYMRPYFKKPESIVVQGPPRVGDFVRYVTDRNIFAVLLFVMVPFSVCQIGLLNYATPIYLSSLGISQSSIGRVLMVYGLSVITVAPLISRFVDRSSNKKIFITLGGIIGGLGLSVLYFTNGILAVLTAVFTLGLASSIGGSAQSAFVLDLDVTKEIGTGKAMSIQRSADKLGQMLGPVFIGAAIAVVGLENGIAISGMIYILCSILFSFTTRTGKS